VKEEPKINNLVIDELNRLKEHADKVSKILPKLDETVGEISRARIEFFRIQNDSLRTLMNLKMFLDVGLPCVVITVVTGFVLYWLYK